MNWYQAYFDVSKGISAIAHHLFGLLTGGFVKSFLCYKCGNLFYFRVNCIENHCLHDTVVTRTRNWCKSMIKCFISQRYRNWKTLQTGKSEAGEYGMPRSWRSSCCNSKESWERAEMSRVVHIFTCEEVHCWDPGIRSVNSGCWGSSSEECERLGEKYYCMTQEKHRGHQHVRCDCISKIYVFALPILYGMWHISLSTW